MALTFTTGMTLASAADSATNWQIVRLAGGGAAPTFSGLDNTVYREGTGAVSGKISVTNTDAAILLDWYANAEGGKTANTTVDLTASGNEVICGWVQLTTPSAVVAYASGGLYMIVSSSTDTGTTAPTVYSKWYIGGGNSGEYPGGWVFYMIDTRKTPSATVGGGAALNAVRRIGFGILRNATVAATSIKADNLFVDAIWYGRPRYQVIGDGATTATWANLYSHSQTNANGLINLSAGAYECSAGLRIGSSTQSATTTFDDYTGRQLVFKRYTYYSGGDVDALNYSDYYSLDANGAASFKTSIKIGSVVGTGDTRQGVLGGAIRSPDITNMTFKVDFATNIANLTQVKLYGFNINGARGGVALDDGTKTSLISCQVVNSGVVDTGATSNGAEILSTFIIDPYGATNNYGIKFSQTPSGGVLSHLVKKLSLITSGTPSTQYMIQYPYTGDYSTDHDGIIFFGDYSSGTLWHGLNSGTNADITINASNGSNANSSEFSNTAGGTVTVVNTVSYVVNNIVDGTEVRILRQSDLVELGGAESVGASPSGINNVSVASDPDNSGRYKITYTYNYSSDTPIYVVVLKEDYIALYLSSVLKATAGTLTSFQIKDRQYI